MLQNLLEPDWRPEDAENMFLVLWRANTSLLRTHLEPAVEVELWELLGDGALRLCQFPTRDYVESGELIGWSERSSGPDDVLGLIDPRDIYKKVLQLREQELGPNHAQTAVAAFKLAQALLLWGNVGKAEVMARRALQIRTARLGSNDVSVAECQLLLGRILRRSGHFDEADWMHSHAWAFWNGRHEDDSSAWDCLCDLAVTRQILGKPAEAVVLAQKLLKAVNRQQKPAEINPRGYIPPFKIGGTTLVNYEYYRCNADAALAAALIDLRRFGEAEFYARENLSIITNSMKSWADWTMGEAQVLLGGALLGQERFEEAEPLLLAGSKMLEALKPRAEPFRIRECFQWLVQLYERWNAAKPGAGKLNEAARWQKRLADFEKYRAQPN